MLRRFDGRRARAEQLADLRQVAFAAEAVAAGVRERRGPAEERVAPLGVVRAVGHADDAEVPRLVDDPSPQLAGLVPAVVTGVRAEHEQDGEDASDHLVGRDAHLGLDAEPVDQEPDGEADQPEAEDATEHERRDGPLHREDVGPEVPAFQDGHDVHPSVGFGV